MTSSFTTPPSRLTVTGAFRRTSGSSTRPYGGLTPISTQQVGRKVEGAMRATTAMPSGTAALLLPGSCGDQAGARDSRRLSRRPKDPLLSPTTRFSLMTAMADPVRVRPVEARCPFTLLGYGHLAIAIRPGQSTEQPTTQDVGCAERLAWKSALRARRPSRSG